MHHALCPYLKSKHQKKLLLKKFKKKKKKKKKPNVYNLLRRQGIYRVHVYRT
jgi:hypothetical protein